ncbi:hypothetical protein HPB50_027118 [Hyalomma asiaticum]|uniref:Uncharacterized protein n=1 Tax=Hyalomma asiaticum TaxID=266040 RepID=A0ACB7RLE1_HYAAI|nr:hypothetical protein HPB50_027118 [Hyalomma asiaticum]
MCRKPQREDDTGDSAPPMYEPPHVASSILFASPRFLAPVRYFSFSVRHTHMQMAQKSIVYTKLTLFGRARCLHDRLTNRTAALKEYSRDWIEEGDVWEGLQALPAGHAQPSEPYGVGVQEQPVRTIDITTNKRYQDERSNSRRRRLEDQWEALLQQSAVVTWPEEATIEDQWEALLLTQDIGKQPWLVDRARAAAVSHGYLA